MSNFVVDGGKRVKSPPDPFPRLLSLNPSSISGLEIIELHGSDFDAWAETEPASLDSSGPAVSPPSGTGSPSNVGACSAIHTP